MPPGFQRTNVQCAFTGRAATSDGRVPHHGTHAATVHRGSRERGIRFPGFHEQFNPVARCENHLCNFLRLRQIADVTAEQADLLSVKGQSQVPGGAGIDDRSGRARLPSASRDKSEITITLSFVTGIGSVSSTTIAPQRQPATWSAAWPW